MFRWYFAVIILVGIIVAWFIAEEFQRIAAMKGHFESRYFWCSFLLGPIGWLMVIALPDHSDRAYYYPPAEENTDDDKPANN